METSLGIIPARYASTRFPGKPLVRLGEKSMISRVYDAVSSVMENLVVATDDRRIEAHVKEFGGQVVMTSEAHRSGTDRCAEALDIFEKQQLRKFNIVINIQGDEPFIRPDQIQSICDSFDKDTVDIATLMKRIENSDVIHDPNRPKIVADKAGFALYFSRSAIPFLRDVPTSEWVNSQIFYQHIGLYGYRSDVLRKLCQLAPGILEKAESLEQLRWLENGFRIKTALTEHESFGIDTPADLERASELGLFS